MNEKRQYTEKDLQVRKLVKISQKDGVTSHTHVVEFGRPLTKTEQELFQSMLIGFYYTVRFSHQFGGDFATEPTFEIFSPQILHYTFHQTTLSGSWKDLLLELLANFSVEVAPIVKYDKNPLFDPSRIKAAAD